MLDRYGLDFPYKFRNFESALVTIKTISQKTYLHSERERVGVLMVYVHISRLELTGWRSRFTIHKTSLESLEEVPYNLWYPTLSVLNFMCPTNIRSILLSCQDTPRVKL